MPLTPVARRFLTDDVYRQLAGQIYAGKLAPGESLPVERDLAKALGVSRVTVRESMQRLAQAGLVGARQGSGRTVLDYRRTVGLEALPSLIIGADGAIDLEAVRSAMELRLSIGADVARLAAERADEALAARLRGFVDQMRAAGDDDGRLQKIAYELWETLVDGSKNIAYRLAFNGLASIYDRCYDALTMVLSSEHRDLASYAQIAEAVHRGDGEAARVAATRLLAHGLTAIVGAALAFGPSVPGALPATIPVPFEARARRAPTGEAPVLPGIQPAPRRRAKKGGKS